MTPISRDQREILRELYLREKRNRDVNELAPIAPYRTWRKESCGRHGMFCVVSPVLTARQKESTR